MLSLIATGLVLAGALILLGSLFPVRRLMLRLPPGLVRDRWYALTALIVLFLASYVGYATILWGSPSSPLELIVPGVFFLGAVFVWLSAKLSLETAIDVMRISVLEEESMTDPLTGVLNRRYLDRRLREEIAKARRYRLPLCVMLLDIDHFKQVNDRHGHQAGDRVLAILGKVASEALRETDVLTRYGGEEFLIIAPHTPRTGALEVAERLRKRIESHDFGLPAAEGVIGSGVTVSIGLACLGEGGKNHEELVRAADENLYLAKQRGRNQVVADP